MPSRSPQPPDPDTPGSNSPPVTLLAHMTVERQLAFYRQVFDHIHCGCMVTDAQGTILLFNQPYGIFLGLDPRAQIGRQVTDVVENTRMHIVAQTGIAELNKTQRIKGQEMVVQRIPIKDHGRVVAVLGHVMFKNVKDVRTLAAKLSLLETKVKQYEEELLNLRSTRYTFDSIVGRSRALGRLKKEALKATANHYPVLITGDSGTGKELFAQAIHHASERRLQPFVRINCAAIPRDLLESELFGYSRGAFTGARTKGKPGKFELAHRGTIFLDEIGDLPVEMQPKLLRVLEDKEFERIGGNKIIRSNFRVIAATNRDLEAMIQNRLFRRDLFYRLNVIPLQIPPLNQRRGDILPITRHLLGKMAQESGHAKIGLTAIAAGVLKQYAWPGNVRELMNVLERAVAAMAGDTIDRHDLPFYMWSDRQTGNREPITSIKVVQSAAEKKAITDALRETGNNKARAAALLGIHRTLLYRKMKKHRIGLQNEAP